MFINAGMMAFVDILEAQLWLDLSLKDQMIMESQLQQQLSLT
jgi:hypothetical protein